VLLAATLTLGVMLPPPAAAAWPVIDVAAIAKLVTQIRTMQNQLTTARNQLTEAQSTLRSMSGGRGMQNLLGGVTRNYLPADFQQLLGVMQGASTAYGALSRDVTSVLSANAVLTAADLARLTPAQRALVDDARRSAATLDVLTRGALASTSGRFAAIQQLINTIGSANDQKAILDLQARIAAEQGMLENESTKLDVLYQLAAVQERERTQRVREQAVADVGHLRALPPMGL
jgi:type IV secretion system protein VirB5